jgi:hypothetical protein
VPSSKVNRPSRSGGKQIPRLYGTREFHYRVHNSSLHILSHMNPVRILTPHFAMTRFNIILSSKPSSSKRSLPFRFTERLDFSTLITYDEQPLRTFSPSSWYFLSHTPKYSPQRPVLKNPHFMFFPWGARQFSGPYKTASKINIIFTFIVTAHNLYTVTLTNGKNTSIAKTKSMTTKGK